MIAFLRLISPGLLLGGALLAQTGPLPVWSTYFGGGGTATHDQPSVNCVLVLPDGNVLLCGETDSTTFPTRNPVQSTLGGATDGFVACFDPGASGNAQLIWATYLGGLAYDKVRGMAVAPNGDVVVCGQTFSQGFPGAPGCYQAGNAGSSDMFVARLAWNGHALALNYFTYLGTTGFEFAESVAILPGGDVVVVGMTDSSIFPIAGTPWQPGYGGGPRDGVVAVLDPTLCTLLASTYHGGSGDDQLHRVEVDGTGALVFAGTTDSINLRVSPGAFQQALAGARDAFVGSGSAALTSLSYCTYLGGTGDDWGLALTLASSGDIVIGGTSGRPLGSPPFPTTNGGTYGGGIYDGFLSILDPTANPSAQLVWSTLIGGVGFESVYDVAVDSSGFVTAVGNTTSANLPTTAGAFQRSFRAPYDGFLARFDPWQLTRTGLERLYLSYYGGSGRDEIFALDLDSEGDPVFAGFTDSANFPITAGAYQPTLAGGYWDAFVAELPLLPTGVTRTVGGPTCPESVLAAVNSAPTPGNALFTLFASEAPANAPGILLLGGPSAPTPLPVPNSNVCLLVALAPTTVSLFLPANQQGFAMHQVSLPLTPLPPYGVSAQWLFLNPANPMGSPFAASPALGL